MNIKIMSAAFGIALTTFAITAKAQKTITEGYASYTTDVRGQPAEAKKYFKPDSTALLITFGAGNVKVLSTAKHDYFAIVLDIPVAQMKKAAVATPAEIEEGMNAAPTFTFTPTTDTKVISGFNCKRVVAKTTDGKSYDVWVTNDITIPSTGISYYYEKIGGVPIQYTDFQQGEEKTVTLTSITEGKAPAGTFGIPAGFDKVGMSDLH